MTVISLRASCQINHTALWSRDGGLLLRFWASVVVVLYFRAIHFFPRIILTFTQHFSITPPPAAPLFFLHKSVISTSLNEIMWYTITRAAVWPLIFLTHSCSLDSSSLTPQHPHPLCSHTSLHHWKDIKSGPLFYERQVRSKMQIWYTYAYHDTHTLIINPHSPSSPVSKTTDAHVKLLDSIKPQSNLCHILHGQKLEM